MRPSITIIASGSGVLAIIGFAMAAVRSSHSLPWLVTGAGGVVTTVCLLLLARHWAKGTVVDQTTVLLLMLPVGMLMMTGVAFAYL